MGIELFIIVTLAFIIFGAIIAVETKNLLSAVISLGVVGFGLSIAFLFLGAPDLAIVQIAVEVVLLIFLIRATIGRDLKSTSAHINWFGLVIIALLLIGFITFGYFAFQELDFGHPALETAGEIPSNVYLEKGLEQTGSSNIVTGILLDYRAYDTLGEATVLFTAIIGALSILRGVARRKKGEKK
jgi:multicomponent Na+:H+ antiporter subunit B